MPDPVAVNSMFARIAGRYDRANRLLSGGIDLWWRRRLIKSVATKSPQDVLDLATGSGDVAFALARELPPGTPITGMDFCQPMLDEAEKKTTRYAAIQAHQVCPRRRTQSAVRRRVVRCGHDFVRSSQHGGSSQMPE